MGHCRVTATSNPCSELTTSTGCRQVLDDQDDEADDPDDARGGSDEPRDPPETRVSDDVVDLDGGSMSVLLTIHMVLGVWHLWQHAFQKEQGVFSASSFENIARVSGRGSIGKLRFFSSVGHIRTIWREVISFIVGIDQFFGAWFGKSPAYHHGRATTLDYGEWVDEVSRRASSLKIIREAVHATFIALGVHSFMRAGASTMVVRHMIGLIIELDGVSNGHRYLSMLTKYKFEYHTMSEKNRAILHNVLCVDMMPHFATNDEFTELTQGHVAQRVSYTNTANFSAGVNRVCMLIMPFTAPTNKMGSRHARPGLPCIGSTVIDMDLVANARNLMSKMYGGIFPEDPSAPFVWADTSGNKHAVPRSQGLLDPVCISGVHLSMAGSEVTGTMLGPVAWGRQNARR